MATQNPVTICGVNSNGESEAIGSTSENINVSINADYRGPYPNNNYSPITVNNDDTALVVKTGTQTYHSLFFEIVSIDGGAGTETIQVLGVSEGGVDMHNLFFKQKDHATEDTIVEGATLGVGVYEYNGILNVAGVKFVKSAGSEVAVIYGQFSGAS